MICVFVIYELPSRAPHFLDADVRVSSPAPMRPADTFHSHQAIRRLCPFAVKRARERRKEERLGLGREAVRGGQGAVRKSASPGPQSILLAAADPTPPPPFLSTRSAQHRAAQRSGSSNKKLFIWAQPCIYTLAPVKSAWPDQKTQSAGILRKPETERLLKDKSIEKLCLRAWASHSHAARRPCLVVLNQIFLLGSE